MTLNSWQEFEKLADKLSEEGPYGPNVYRGQLNENWALYPSLSRIFKNNNITRVNAIEIEKRIHVKFFNESIRSGDEYCKSIHYSDILSWWEIMQHHGVPTRLLDWSRSPYAALFFALDDSNVDGALYVLDAAHLQWIQTVRAKEKQNDYEKWTLLQIENSINKQQYEKSMDVVSCPTPTSRMLNQESSFTITTELLKPHDVVADHLVFHKVINRNKTHSVVQKIIVPKGLKKSFSYALSEKGFNSTTVYPDNRVIDKLTLDMNTFVQDILNNGVK